MATLADKVESAERTFDEFIGLANVFCLSIGLVPYRRQRSSSESRSGSVGRFVYMVFGCLNMNFVIAGGGVYAVQAFMRHEHFLDGILCLAYISFTCISTFNMLTIWAKRRRLTVFMDRLMAIHPRGERRQAAFRVAEHLRRSRRVNLAFALMYMVLVWSFSLIPLLEFLVVDRWLHWRRVQLGLPYVMAIPWEYRDNWTFYALYVSNITAGYTAAAAHVASDLLLASTVAVLVMHFDHLAARLADRRSGGGAEDRRFLQDFVVYHERLLRLTKAMNEVFGVPLLFNFFSSALVICFMGFELTVGVDGPMKFAFGLGCFGTGIRIYLICHYGQLLQDSSVNIARAAYNQDWTGADPAYKKMLLQIANRAQKPAIIQATSFLCVTSRTMTETIQISYKVFALVRFVYNK